MNTRKINVPGLGRLPAFSHATVAGDTLYVAGTLGTQGESFELAAGGTGPETRQTLENIGRILAAASVAWGDVAKVNVYLSDMSTFSEMNRAYMKFFRDKLGEADLPARITIGGAVLALEAAIEIDCIAHKEGL